jgi:hypothetical protein
VFLLGAVLLIACGHLCVSGCARGDVSAAGTPAALPQFVDVTREAGVEFRHHTGAFGKKYMPESTGSGCAFFDADGDGRLDLLALNGCDWPERRRGTYRPALFRNRADGSGRVRFEDVTEGAGLPEDRYGMGVAVADYDGDGDEDLYLTCLGPNFLLRNRGDGTVEDVTARAGVAGAPVAPGGLRWKWSSSAAWLDYDRDGWLDLFVCNYVRWSPQTDVVCRGPRGEKAYCAPTSYAGVPCTLYRNQGDGSFADVSEATGIRAHTGKSLGVAVADMDGDGWSDIVVANDMTPNFLFLNRKGKRFDEVGSEWGIAVGESGRAKAGMGIDAADWENVGRPGVLIGNFTYEALSLFGSAEGEGVEDRTYEAGMGEPSLHFLTFGLFFVDYDLDGWKDAFIGNGHIDDTLEGSKITYRQRPLLFRREPGQRFREVGLASGAALKEQLVVRGCAHGDYDRDGDPDVAVLWNGAGLRLWRNDGGNRNHWLGLRLVGRPPNRSALGARVQVTAGDLTVTEWVRSGSSYLSSSQRWPVIGLGARSKADRVVVTWPGGRREEFGALDAGRYYTVRESEGISS